jgi:hypothetical protein
LSNKGKEGAENEGRKEGGKGEESQKAETKDE